MFHVGSSPAETVWIYELRIGVLVSLLFVCMQGRALHAVSFLVLVVFLSGSFAVAATLFFLLPSARGALAEAMTAPGAISPLLRRHLAKLTLPGSLPVADGSSF